MVSTMNDAEFDASPHSILAGLGRRVMDGAEVPVTAGPEGLIIGGRLVPGSRRPVEEAVIH